MKKTPKSLRLHLGLFGRTNVGKSTFLNYITNQKVSIVSSLPGTTTDVVEKAMELLPIGPVLFLDTAGIDDDSELSSLRIEKTAGVFERSDIFILVVESGVWGKYEEMILQESKKQKAPLIVVINKADIRPPAKSFQDKIKKDSASILVVSSRDKQNQDFAIHEFKRRLIDLVPGEFLNPPPVIGDLIPRGGTAVLIIPIDKEAPRGRIILPQVQTIRDILDHSQVAVTVKESEYTLVLKKLKTLPDIVVCDSQVVDKMIEDTPAQVNCTTFSVLFARLKGDLPEMIKSLEVVDTLRDKDKILVAESCTHHPIEDDIGRVKIPRWFREYTGRNLVFDFFAGKDFPSDLREYKLIIQCGGCMMTRREILSRIEKAKSCKVPITNYGLCISFLRGVLNRILSPFKADLAQQAKRRCIL
jgi:[FeFe] hydrogenase H-cluster maturation GTPase HydF